MHYKDPISFLTFHSFSGIHLSPGPRKADGGRPFVAPCAKNPCMSGALLTGTSLVQMSLVGERGIQKGSHSLAQAGLELAV